MTSTITPPAEAQPKRAGQIRAAIGLLIGLDQADLLQALAQVVAGHIAESDSTAMRDFATTGRLNTEALLSELEHIQVPFEQEAWVDALARVVLFTTGGRS